MHLKHFIVLLGMAATTSMLCISNIKAQGGSEQYLQLIEQHTRNILQKVDLLPNYLANASELVLAWITPMTPDNSPPLKTMQAPFTQLGDLLLQSQAKQAEMLATMNSDLLNNDGKNVFNANNGHPNSTGIASPSTLWYANDLVYSSVLGTPFFAKDPRVQPGAPSSNINLPYNYIKNAAGLNLYHKIPDPSWKASDARTRYQSYFNTVMAAESFNGYILSHQAAEGNQLNTLQTTLVTQATDPQNWFAQVASENIGFVLRQILLYQSQTFVLLTQLIQLQKQMVTAQAMTNSLLIAANQVNENLMVSSAQGVQPTL
ncbi:MAG: hypothetical protein KIT56_10780 [Gammaproteobacteria bacterium]|nr:hypothetical protein [Gammaproteobacteria bacterium]MCW5584329.1 hypothetical protein [Gammaproteobacteria bacterium]